MWIHLHVIMFYYSFTNNLLITYTFIIRFVNVYYDDLLWNCVTEIDREANIPTITDDYFERSDTNQCPLFPEQ